MNLLPVFSSRVYVPHVEADQDLGRLKKKNGLLGSNTILLRVNTFNDVFLREIELHMGFIEKSLTLIVMCIVSSVKPGGYLLYP